MLWFLFCEMFLCQMFFDILTWFTSYSPSFVGAPPGCLCMNGLIYGQTHLLHKLSSGSMQFLAITLEMRMISQNIWRRVVGDVLINISLSNIFPTTHQIILKISLTILSDSWLHGSFFEPFQCWDYFCQKHKNAKIFQNHLNTVMLEIHWIVLAEYSQMSTHVPGFRSFFRIFASFYIG